MQSLLRRLAPSPNSEARTNFWLACIPLGVFILARAAIELDALLAAGRAELDQLDKAIAGRRDALAGAYSESLHTERSEQAADASSDYSQVLEQPAESAARWHVENGHAEFNDKAPRDTSRPVPAE